MNNKNAAHKTSVGGQALIEGVMMQGPRGLAVSVRTPNGSIDTEYQTVTHVRDKVKFLGWPVIRGMVNFVESMITGYKCLMLSADKSGMADLEEEEEPSKFEKWVTEKLGDKFMGVLMTFASILGIALAFVIFFWMPVALFNGVKSLLPHPDAFMAWKGTFEGVLRIVIFVAYIALVSRMKDINRLFQYHGAEHKTIFCYENGEELTVENVRRQSRFHPRCGTSFLFVMLIISIVVSSVLVKLFPAIAGNTVLWLLLKIAFIPLIMGIGYEFIKYAGRHDNWFVKILSAPGLWMQRLTTKEPTEDGIIEVGIASLKAVITDNPEDDRIV